MKHEIQVDTPENLEEIWPGSYQLFSWLDYVVNIPQPIFVISTRKANGAPNACLHAWGFLVGDRENYTSILGLLDYYHTFENILRDGEWCLNYPSIDDYEKCFETIHVNEIDKDEITLAGLSVEAAQVIQSPRIAECQINLECQLEWHRPLYQDSQWHLVAGRVVHVAMGEDVLTHDPAERMQNLKLMYNIRGTLNPVSGEMYGPNSLGLISEVVKAFDQGADNG
ncbi:MAG: flavin reductase family protein [Anaerolineales bacterium]|jgi:flavin reductase (DIM6/NTAB) family NADH-FMN oxidoreductase RutF